MMMRRRAPQMMKQWLVLGGLLVLLHALFFLGWIVIMTSPRPAVLPMILLTAGYLVIFIIILVVFTKRLARAVSPREYQEAREQGVAVTAKILEMQRTRWRIRRNLNFRLQITPARYEYEMRVRITPPDAPQYEARLTEFFSGGQIPEIGDSIWVRIHPKRPEIIVLARDKSA